MSRVDSPIIELVVRLLLVISLVRVYAEGPPTSSAYHHDQELECHLAEDYTTKWFLLNAKPEYRRLHALKNTALFYSAGMSCAVRDYAKANKLTTVWDVWPCYLYNHLDHRDNPLRCIHGKDEDRAYFFGGMSRAFAMMAQNFSTVLHSCDNYGRPPTNGIWGMVEFPTLQSGGVVDFLEKVNENKTLRKIFWRRPREIVAGFWESLTGNGLVSHGGDLKRRTLSDKSERGPPPLPTCFHGTCMSPKELALFDNVEW